MLPLRTSEAWTLIVQYVKAGVSPDSALAIHGIAGRRARRLLAAVAGEAPPGRWPDHVADLRAAIGNARGKTEAELRASEPLAWLKYQRDVQQRLTEAFQAERPDQWAGSYRLLCAILSKLEPCPELRDQLVAILDSLPASPRKEH